jgi:hypothetical protein
MWHRVFGTDAGPVQPVSLLDHLHGLGFEAAGHFRGDEQGWFRAELRLPEQRAALQLERYLAEEEGIRDELNTWAAWLEEAADGPHRDDLMRHLIATAQLFTLRQAPGQEDDGEAGEACALLCRFLAGRTAGVYQVDGQGFFSADGTLLVPE